MWLCMYKGHKINISFSFNIVVFHMQFLPNTSDQTIATGAADCKVRVHNVPNLETTHAFSCHAGRVKRLVAAPNVPYMFWSAGEDGTVR